MRTNELTDDAKAILLLCGRFGKQDKNEKIKPLSIGEYNRLADWLMSRKLRPSDLLKEDTKALVASGPLNGEMDRIRALLGRGALLALFIEKWINKGIWIVCRSDTLYPDRLKKHLKRNAPPVLYGAGDIHLLSYGGLAVVGSRNVDEAGERFTKAVGQECAKQGITVVSGGARGVDRIAMTSALESGGIVIAVLANNLIKAVVSGKYRNGIREKRLVLVSPYHPDASFNVGNAMSRNKHIYAFSDYALVISAEYNKGGTWSGAAEELRRENPIPVFVRNEGDVPVGNRELLKSGALAFPQRPWNGNFQNLLTEQINRRPEPAIQQRSLFDDRPMPAPAEVVKEDRDVYKAEKNDFETVSSKEEKVSEFAPASIYESVLPLILNSLTDWTKPEEIAKLLNVRKVQLDDWLKQALKEEKVVKKSRPVRYRRTT